MGKSSIIFLLALVVLAINAKSAKRGIAYNLAGKRDIEVLSPGVSWWYNWALRKNVTVPRNYGELYNMEFIPMLWNFDYHTEDVMMHLETIGAKYFMVLNEPNLVDQANITPQRAAVLWSGYEYIAKETGAKIVGPQITWGTMPGYEDPVVWMDTFIDTYKARHGGREPRFDVLGFHWYDYGLDDQLERLEKYGKHFWVTELANWHKQKDGAQIDSTEKQKRQCKSMVKICEQHPKVDRYAWFTGRWNNDIHHTSLLGGDGELTDLGKFYVNA